MPNLAFSSTHITYFNIYSRSKSFYFHTFTRKKLEEFSYVRVYFMVEWHLQWYYESVKIGKKKNMLCLSQISLGPLTLFLCFPSIFFFFLLISNFLHSYVWVLFYILPLRGVFCFVLLSSDNQSKFVSQFSWDFFLSFVS